jgi:hypothetical protein
VLVSNFLWATEIFHNDDDTIGRDLLEEEEGESEPGPNQLSAELMKFSFAFTAAAAADTVCIR